MRFGSALGVMLLSVTAFSSQAQTPQSSGLGEVVVTGSRQNARYAQENRPVIGLRRQADSAVMSIALSSDARDAEVRQKEVHSMLLAAIDKAGAAGLELVIGSFELTPVTKTNYGTLPLSWAGRVDTSKVDVMVKAKLAGSLQTTEAKINDFIKSLPKPGRGAVDKSGTLVLTVFNPDQYREEIVKLVAEEARRQVALFGPDYGVQVGGLDGQVFWSQVSPTEVFLYLPYRYTIVPK